MCQETCPYKINIDEIETGIAKGIISTMSKRQIIKEGKKYIEKLRKKAHEDFNLKYLNENKIREDE